MPKYARRRVNRRKRPVRPRKALARYRRKMPLYKLPLGGYGRSKMVRLRYVETITLNPGLGALAQYVFNANDMRDPNATGIGHQPRGFDEAMLGYEHFTVVGSKITAAIVPQISGQVQDTQTPFVWGINVCPVSALGGGVSTVDEILETKDAKGYRIAGQNTGAGAYRKGVSMTRYFSARKFFSKKEIVASGIYRGNVSQSPAELAHFIIWGGPLDGAAVNPDAQPILVTIDYLAVLTEPKALQSS